jgi:hypothetical protein
MSFSKDGEEYSLIYCTLHDTGCIVKGEHLYSLPTKYNFICSGSNCENVDWINVGVISVINNKVIVNKKIVDVDKKYGGGSKIKYFDIVDDCGQISDIDKSIIGNWQQDY